MKKAVDTLQKIQIAIGGGFLLIFLVTVVYQMLCRYLGIAAMWTEDVTMYSFIWAVFTGAGAMVHSKGHFAFTSVSDTLKDPRKKAILQIFINIVMLVFAVLELQMDQYPKHETRTDMALCSFLWGNRLHLSCLVCD